jgi:23S rRNA A1618 N6-methylase RlmF
VELPFASLAITRQLIIIIIIASDEKYDRHHCSPPLLGYRKTSSTKMRTREKNVQHQFVEAIKRRKKKERPLTPKVVFLLCRITNQTSIE